MLIAISASVTVSMGDETKGVLRVIRRDRREVRSTYRCHRACWVSTLARPVGRGRRTPYILRSKVDEAREQQDVVVRQARAALHQLVHGQAVTRRRHARHLEAKALLLHPRPALSHPLALGGP